MAFGADIDIDIANRRMRLKRRPTSTMHGRHLVIRMNLCFHDAPLLLCFLKHLFTFSTEKRSNSLPALSSTDSSIARNPDWSSCLQFCPSEIPLLPSYQAD